MNKSIAHANLTGELARRFESACHRKDHGFRAAFVRDAVREKLDRDFPRPPQPERKTKT